MAKAKRAKAPTRGKRAKEKERDTSFISDKKRFILFIACFIVLAVLMGVALINSLEKLSTLSEQKDQFQEERTNMIADNERLTEEAEFTSSREYVEYMARKLLGWVKPGETKYIEQD